MSYYLGIDIGTTYTAAAVWRDERCQIASLGNRAPTIPSVVLLRDDEAVLTGEAAVRRAATEPGRVAREFKRRVGDPTPIIVGGTPYSADALIAKLLRSVVDQVSGVEGGPPAGIAVSHPANWGNYKLDLLRQSINLADLDDVATISEPEAAAIHYASQARVEPGSVIAVYDLGGGTFDAAVLRKTGGGWQILGSPEGIERLGGVDFDQAVFHHVAEAVGGAIDGLDPDDPTAQAAVARLRQECIDAKEALSSDSDVSIPVMLPNLQTEVRLTRSEYEGMVRPALADTITAMNRALRSADVTPDQVTAVLLVGGSSRTPLVAELVSSALGRPVAVDAHPKYGVAMGAAITAATRAGAAGRAPGGGDAPAAGVAGPGVVGAAAVGGAAGAARSYPTGVAAADGMSAAGAGPTGGADHDPAGVAAAVDATAAAGDATARAKRGSTDGAAAGGVGAAGFLGGATSGDDAGAPDPVRAPVGPATARQDAVPGRGRPAGARHEEAPTRAERPTARRATPDGRPAPGREGRDPRSVTVPYGGDRADRPAERAGASTAVGAPIGAPVGERARPTGRTGPAGGGGGARSDHDGNGSDRPGGRRPLLVALGVVAVLALGGGIAALALSGDDDDPGTAAGAEGTGADTADGATGGEAPTTAPATTPTTEAPPAGPFVQIDDVTLEGGQYRVHYQVIGYEPEIGGEGTLHVHLFPDTQDPATAGTNGVDGVDHWFVTDEPSSALTDYTPDTVAGASQMCAAVADHGHAVHTPEVRTGNCADLP